MNNLCLPMKVITITQKSGGSYSHPNFCLDLAGSDTGIDFCFAMGNYWRCIAGPWGSNTYFFTACDAKGNAESVHCADGINRIVTMALTHSDFVCTPRPVIGKVYKNGEAIYSEGTYGQATGNHVHLEVAAGLQYSKTYDNKLGVYRMPNELKPEDVFYICDSFSRVASMGGAVMKHCAIVEYEKPTTSKFKDGYQEITISGVKVTAYKSSHRLGLINAGGLKPLAQIDMPGILIYERSGNDLFDAVGTVYGPRICINGQVDEPEDSKNYLYYAILKDGSLSFGDWDGQYKDPAAYQCMFSPKAIYAMGKATKYAPQYGIKALSESVWQAYIAHLADGAFVKGVSKGAIKAAALWSGLQAYGADSLAIMDGGSGGIGSAQQRYWNGSAAVDAQTSGRAVGDILVFYEPSSEAEKPANPSDSPEKDYQSMYETKAAELAALQAQYAALLEQYTDLKKTNAENLQTANELKTKYEEAINKVLDILKDVAG